MPVLGSPTVVAIAFIGYGGNTGQIAKVGYINDQLSNNQLSTRAFH